MKIFATDYLEAWSDGMDGNNWSWKPLNMPNKQTGPGRPTKSTLLSHSPSGNDSHPDEDMPQEGMASGMLCA